MIIFCLPKGPHIQWNTIKSQDQHTRAQGFSAHHPTSRGVIGYQQTPTTSRGVSCIKNINIGSEISWLAWAFRIKTRSFSQPVTSPSHQPFSSSGSWSATLPPCYTTCSLNTGCVPPSSELGHGGVPAVQLCTSDWQNHHWSAGCTADTVSCMLYHLCR